MADQQLAVGNTPGAAPEVSQPYSIPAGMTPEQAQARLDELKQDKEWGARWMKAGPSSREAREFDALTRHVVGAEQPKAKVELSENDRALAALGAPPQPADYNLLDVRDPKTGFLLRLDEANHTLVHGTMLPAAHALDLSQGDVNMIAANITKPSSWEDCEAALHRLWGPDFDARLDDFRAAVTDPKHRALLEEFPEQLGNNPMVIASVVAAYRRRQARR